MRFFILITAFSFVGSSAACSETNCGSNLLSAMNNNWWASAWSGFKVTATKKLPDGQVHCMYSDFLPIFGKRFLCTYKSDGTGAGANKYPCPETCTSKTL